VSIKGRIASNVGMIEHYDTTADVDANQFAAVSAPRGRTLKQQQKIDN